MDPLSILASAAAVSKIVWNCSTALCSFVDQVSTADQAIKELYNETETLRRTLGSITQTLQSPSLKKHDRIPLWEDVDACLAECKNTLHVFSERLERIGPAAAGKSSIFKSAAQVFKMQFKDEDIRTLRAQIQSHAFSMQMVLQLITVHISSSTPDVVLDELAPQLRTLMDLVIDLHKASISQEGSTPGIRRSRTRLERSARELASKASVVISSRSTTWSGSQAGQIGTATVIASKPSRTTGSELGEPLSVESRDRISQWVTNDFRDDTTIGTIHEESPSLFSEPIEGSAETHTTPGEVLRPGRTFQDVEADPPGDDDDDDDEDIEIEIVVAQQYLTEGRKRVTDDPTKAEEFLRKAVSKLRSIKSVQSAEETPQVTLEIGVICFQQDKLSAAIEVATQLMRDTPTNDRSRVLVLQASHLLSQVHLRSGHFDAALRQCKRTLNGRRRLQGKDNSYFESVALMSAIYKYKGDEIESLAYEGLLPVEFSKIEFKPPNPSLSVTARSSETTSQHSRNSARASTIVEDQLATELEDTSDAIYPTISNESNTLKRDSTANSWAVVDEGKSATSQDRPTADRSASDIDLSKLPRAMAARLSAAKALADTISAHRAKSFSSTTSTLVDASSSVDEPLDMQKNHQRKLKASTQGDQVAALTILRQNGRISLAMADLADHFLWAASRGYDSVVRLLLTDWVYHKRVAGRLRGLKGVKMEEIPRSAVDVDVVDARKLTALHIAASHGHCGIVKMLLECGASRYGRANGVDDEGEYSRPGLGRTPMEYAIISGDVPTVTCFRPLGMNDHKLDHFGQSLLHHAAASGKREMLDIVLEEGFDIGARSNNGTTALHVASGAGNYDIVDRLLFKGANANDKDDSGTSALLMAARTGDERCFSRLVLAGANVRTRNSQRSSLLHIAVQYGHMGSLGGVVFRAVEIDCRNSAEQTPLHLAAQFGQSGSIDALLALGASVDAKDKAGNTPILLAIPKSSVAVVQRLLQAGASASSTNIAGKTPLMVATMNRREDVIRLLNSHQSTPVVCKQ